MLAAKAAETQRRSITMSFPSVARSSLNLLRGLVSLELSGTSSIWFLQGLVARDVANADRLLLPLVCASDDTRVERARKCNLLGSISAVYRGLPVSGGAHRAIAPARFDAGAPGASSPPSQAEVPRHARDAIPR